VSGARTPPPLVAALALSACLTLSAQPLQAAGRVVARVVSTATAAEKEGWNRAMLDSWRNNTIFATPPSRDAIAAKLNEIRSLPSGTEVYTVPGVAVLEAGASASYPNATVRKSATGYEVVAGGTVLRRAGPRARIFRLTAAATYYVPPGRRVPAAFARKRPFAVKP
jgi:predicted phage tail protein